MNKTDKYIIYGSLFITFFIIFLHLGSSENLDFYNHTRAAKNLWYEKDFFQGNFLMYLAINLMSLFSGKFILMRISLAILLSLSIIGKYYYTTKGFSVHLESKLAHIASFCFIFVYIIPILICKDELMYYGYFVPTVWHNSTIILTLPFVLRIYQLSCMQLEQYNAKTNYKISILILISTLIKPSFTFIFCCAYPVLLLTQYGLSKRFFVSSVPVFVGVIGCAYIYVSTFTGSHIEGDNSIAFTLEKMASLDISFLLHLLASYCFPIIVLLCYRNKDINRSQALFITLLNISAILISLLFMETGDRATHGNLSWQITPASMLTFYSASMIVFKDIKNHDNFKFFKFSKANILLWILTVHCFVGLVYLTRIIATFNYT